jgi:translation initiation factor 2B subunit (eIF-2B alpha/beta/delta family)
MKESQMSEVMERSQVDALTAEEAKERVKEKGSELREKASGRLRDEVEVRTESASEQIRSFVQTLRRTAAELRAEGSNGQSQIFDQVAAQVERVGAYLTNAEQEKLRSDAVEYGRRGIGVVREQPWLVAPLGLGVGLFASRFRRSGSQGGR